MDLLIVRRSVTWNISPIRLEELTSLFTLKRRPFIFLYLRRDPWRWCPVKMMILLFCYEAEPCSTSVTQLHLLTLEIISLGVSLVIGRSSLRCFCLSYEVLYSVYPFRDFISYFSSRKSFQVPCSFISIFLASLAMTHLCFAVVSLSFILRNLVLRIEWV